MSLRTFSLGLALVLVACRGGDDDRSAAIATDGRVVEARADNKRIDCALSGAASFATVCTVERNDGTLVVLRHPDGGVLRHPDGGFRRITLASDKSIDAADGSEAPLGKTLPDGRFELTLGNDRYRLPADLR